MAASSNWWDSAPSGGGALGDWLGWVTTLPDRLQNLADQYTKLGQAAGQVGSDQSAPPVGSGALLGAQIGADTGTGGDAYSQALQDWQRQVDQTNAYNAEQDRLAQEANAQAQANYRTSLENYAAQLNGQAQAGAGQAAPSQAPPQSTPLDWWSQVSAIGALPGIGGAIQSAADWWNQQAQAAPEAIPPETPRAAPPPGTSSQRLGELPIGSVATRPTGMVGTQPEGAVAGTPAGDRFLSQNPEVAIARASRGTYGTLPLLPIEPNPFPQPSKEGNAFDSFQSELQKEDHSLRGKWNQISPNQPYPGLVASRRLDMWEAAQVRNGAQPLTNMSGWTNSRAPDTLIPTNSRQYSGVTGVPTIATTEQQLADAGLIAKTPKGLLFANGAYKGLPAQRFDGDAQFIQQQVASGKWTKAWADEYARLIGLASIGGRVVSNPRGTPVQRAAYNQLMQQRAESNPYASPYGGYGGYGGYGYGGYGYGGGGGGGTGGQTPTTYYNPGWNTGYQTVRI